MRRRPTVVHVTTVDMSLVVLLGPQLRAFAAAGYDVVGASAAGPWVDELESWGIRHVPLHHATRAVAPGRDLRAMAELAGLFRELRPEIVHTHTPKAGVYGRLAARATGVPAIVNTLHGLYALPDDPWAKRAVVYTLERLAVASSDAELVQSPEDVEILTKLGIPRRKLRLLGNGIDLERFDPRRMGAGRVAETRRRIGAGPGDVVAILVGRLVAEKGYREVFAAAARLRSQAPAVLFVVAGPVEPDKADAITSGEMARAEAEGRLHFLGLRHDVEDLYAAGDVYVLASHREGFPRSAMEAAAMGLPLVVTDIRGCRQVVEAGATGLLVPARDPDALAAAVATLADDAGLRRRLGRSAREKALREFDQRRVIDITLETYESLLTRPRRQVAA